MHRFVIEDPGTITVLIRVKARFDSNQYHTPDFASEEVAYIVEHATSDQRDEYMHFENVELVSIEEVSIPDSDV